MVSSVREIEEAAAPPVTVRLAKPGPPAGDVFTGVFVPREPPLSTRSCPLPLLFREK